LWLNRIPVSMTYACTVGAVDGYVYEPLSGRLRWSMRSRPQLGGLFWVSWMRTVWFCSTYATDGSAAIRAARAAVAFTSKPRSAARYVRATAPSCLAARSRAALSTPARVTELSLNTTM
jgi:hypothetical protein